MSKRALGKIKPEGQYEGKNKMYLDGAGNSLKTDDQTDYIKQLRKDN